jgi:hypothetical protein
LSITNATDPFLLTFADTYAAGWVIEGLPRTWTASHVVANGYSNGWIINGQGPATLTIRYRPDRIIEWARTLSLVALGAAVIVLAYPRLQRRRRGERP